MFNRIISVLVSVLFIVGCSEHQESTTDFVQVDGINFVQNGKAFEYVGTNFWYGAYLGRFGNQGDRERLRRELDFLVNHGITNLRILGASEESVFKNSLSPTFINTDGSYNEELLIGLDYFFVI